MTQNTSTRIPGNNVKFDFKGPEELKQFTDSLVDEAKSFYDGLGGMPLDKVSFENIVQKTALFEGRLETMMSSIALHKDLHPEKAIRDMSAECTNQLNEVFIDIYSRNDLYERFKKVKDDTEAYNALNDLDKRLLDRYMRDFERNGLALPKDKQDRVKEINKKLSSLAVKFQQNIGEDSTKYLFTEQELEGCPDAFVQGLKKDPATGKRVVTLKYPDLFPVLQYAKKPETRRIMDYLKLKQCQNDNIPIFEEILTLRRELTKLMGYNNYADFALEVKMAKNSETVMNFLNDLRSKLTEPGKEELKELLKYKQKDGIDEEFKSYDWHYYFRVRKESEFSVDDEAVKQYFPTKKVIAGTFEMLEKLFKLKFVEEKEHTELGHMVLYSIYEQENPDKIVGQLYLDLHPRDGKYSHACMMPLQPACETDSGERQFGVAAMVCNFPKDRVDSETGKVVPSTLPFNDVITWLHELGHCLHSVLSKAKYAKFSGTSVSPDFVETPSQFLENWGWHTESLQMLSEHVDTKEPLPEDMIKKLIAAKNCNVALFNLRQLFFGFVDMKLHTSNEHIDTQKLWNEMRPEIQLVKNPEGTNGFGGFAHLVGGYQAGYYGYLWALSYAQDLFSRFEKEGIFNEQAAKDYKKWVLEKGDEIDNTEIIKNFLGREPNNVAFLKGMGIDVEDKDNQ